MSLFLSTYTNKIDKKGRISIPSQFRNSMADEKFPGVIIYPSVINPCLEGCAMSRIEKISESIDQLDVLSEERDAFATSILGASTQLAFDNEGRVVLPKEMITLINIDETAVFIGKGQTFEIWHPEQFKEHLKKSQQLAIEKRNMLRFNR